MLCISLKYTFLLCSLLGAGIFSTLFAQSKIQLPAHFELHGHRGARGLFPENSIYGFVETAKMGVKVLEMDVVVSKDQQIIVSHEPYLNPTICLLENGAKIKGKGKQYNLYQMTAAEIQRFDCGTKKHPRFPEQKKLTVHKPTLNQVVAAIDKLDTSIRFNIEMKASPKGDDLYHPVPAVFAQLLYQTLVELNIKDRVTIQSFDVRCLQEMRALDENVPLVLLVENFLSVERNLVALGFKPAVYSPYYKLLKKETVVQLHKAGIKVIPWTVNDANAMKALIDLQVDGIITDYPDRFYELIGKP
ncbi:MAG: glycerophosphodiester phosphodiesterase family protein [Thermonemataceae bacterium]